MRPSVSKFGSNCDQLVGTAIVRRLSLIAGLATLFFAALGLARSKRVSCLLEVRLPREVTRSPTSNYSPLTGTATGSNVNEISNTGQVVGVTVDANGAPTSTNFSATPCTTLTQLNTGAGQIAFRINSAGNLVGGNGTNAFFLLNGGSPQTLITPPGAINGFGINDKGNIVGQFTSGANTPGFILPSSASATFTTINQPAGVTANVINAQGINNNGLVVGFYLGNDGQVHGFNANAPASPGGSITATANYRPDHPRQPQPTRRHVCVLPDPRVPGRPRQRCSTTAWRLPRSPGSPTRARSLGSTPMPTAHFTASLRFQRFESANPLRCCCLPPGS